MGILFPELPDKIAVAVSGGADSLCLTLLLKEWADSKKIQFSWRINMGYIGEKARGERLPAKELLIDKFGDTIVN